MSKLACVEHYEERSKEVIEKSALAFYSVGCGKEDTLQRNKEAFRKLRIRPRVLRDVSNVNMNVEVFAHTIDWPVGISPSALQKMACPEGEVASARAAGKAGTLFVLSSASTTSLEEVAEKAPNTHKWFHLYIFKDRLVSF